MFSKKYHNPLDCKRSIVFTYGEIWLLNLVVHSKYEELNYLFDYSCYADPDYLKKLEFLSSKLGSLVETFENDLPF